MPAPPFSPGLSCSICATGIKRHWVQIRGTRGERGNLSRLVSKSRQIPLPTLLVYLVQILLLFSASVSSLERRAMPGS